MAAPKRTPFERERDLVEIARLMVRGNNVVEIANELKVSASQVRYDIKTVEQRWHDAATDSLNAYKEKELAKLDELERTYWKAWVESLKPKTTEYVERGEGEKGPQSRTGRRIEVQTGNPAYLNGVLSCIDRRIKLLGLDAPIKIDISEKVRTVAREMGLDEEEAVREAQRIIQSVYASG